MLSSTILQHFFPNLDGGILHELVGQQGDSQQDQRVLVGHLLQLSDVHWLAQLTAEVKARRKVTVILRGLPGAGKTTLANVISTALTSDCDFTDSDVFRCSADDFFIDKAGNYIYIPNLISKAHEWCQNKCKKAMKEAKKMVIVDNTNCQIWEMQPYLKLSAEHGYTVLLLEPDTRWIQDPSVLSKKTTHGVPIDKIKTMKTKFDKMGNDFKEALQNLPKQFKPEVITIQDVMKRHVQQNDSGMVSESDGGVIREGASSSSSSVSNSSNADFQSLLQCFPDLDVSTLYFAYVQSGQNVDRAVDILLQRQSKESSESEDSDDSFAMQLDADFASKLENTFGKVRQTNFPGALDVKIPESLARSLHHYWKVEMDAKMTLAAVEKLTLLDQDKTNSRWATSNNNVVKVVNANGFDQVEEDEVFEEVPEVSRQEIEQLKARRFELYTKAASHFKARQGGVAGYYSEEGRKITDKINKLEADFRYWNFIETNKDQNNVSIDLHGLTVKEALEQLQWFLEEKAQQLKRTNKEKVRLEIITGRGKSSTSPRIKPAVEAMLRREQLQYNEINKGSISIVIKSNFVWNQDSSYQSECILVQGLVPWHTCL